MGTPIRFKGAKQDEAPKGAFSTVPDEERKRIDERLLPFAEQVLEALCGQLQVNGDEISMLNPLRDDRTFGSFKFNRKTGAWSDFAADDFAGHGLVMLYSRLKDLPLQEAIAELATVAADVPAAISADSEVQPDKPAKPAVAAVDPSQVALPPDVHPELFAPTAKWAYYNADGQLSFYVYRFDHDGKKETRPVAWSAEKKAWLWRYPPPPFPLYRLSELLARPEAVVVVAEGEKAADAGARQFPDAAAVTSACGSEQALRSDWTPLKRRSVIIAPDKDAPGKSYALSVAGAALANGAESVAVLDVWQLPDWGTGDDLADHQVSADFLASAVELFAFAEPTELEPHVVKAAVQLGKGDFDRIKKSLADQLGIGVRTFEGLVKEARKRDAGDADADAAEPLFEDDVLEPWDEPVNGESLFSEIVALIERFVVLTKAQAVTIACWIIFSYGFERMRICPQLLISSPSKRCGKTTLLELIMTLVRRPLPAANISSSAVFRSIDHWKPTLLIDEADTFLASKTNEEIVGILNSGHNRNLAYVVRTQEVGGDHVPRQFSTFCPKVIAMIKAPADTIIDRSIVISLERKLTAQRVEALPIDAVEQMRDVRRRILRWVEDNGETVKFDIEAVPELANDRARQNWCALAGFAVVLGDTVYSALLNAISQIADTSTVESNVEIDLLTDIRDCLRGFKQDHVQSKVIIKELLKLDDRPWCEVNRGKELTANKLAWMLRPFGLTTRKYRDGNKSFWAYSVQAFRAVFDRYLPADREGA